jgi:hypothetical protein
MYTVAKIAEHFGSSFTIISLYSINICTYLYKTYTLHCKALFNTVAVFDTLHVTFFLFLHATIYGSEEYRFNKVHKLRAKEAKKLDVLSSHLTGGVVGVGGGRVGVGGRIHSFGKYT